MAYICIIHAIEALDLLQERLPGKYAAVRRHANRITGTKAHMGEARRIELAIGDHLAHAEDKAWVADFGNAAYAQAEGDIYTLQTALANALGRYGGVPDRNVCAAVVVAQSLAQEAVEYVKRRAAKFRDFTITTHDGRRTSVSASLASMSCAGISHSLEAVARALLEPCLPDGTDLLADPSVATWVKAVMNRLCDVDTWTAARDKADELNGIRNENNK